MNKFDALDLEDSQISGSEDEVEEEKKEEADKEVTPAPIEIAEGDHPLQYAYALWFSKRPPGKQQFNYEENIKLVGKFASVEQFWSLYSWLIHPSELTGHCDYHLFKDGIKPMWEDEANQFGGKWIVRLKKGLASRFWENLILAILGEQFMVGDEICGAVISIRFQEDIISVWNRTYSDQAVTTRIRDTLKRVLSLPMNTILEYKTHNNSIRYSNSKLKPRYQGEWEPGTFLLHVGTIINNWGYNASNFVQEKQDIMLVFSHQNRYIR